MLINGVETDVRSVGRSPISLERIKGKEGMRERGHTESYHIGCSFLNVGYSVI